MKMPSPSDIVLSFPLQRESLVPGLVTTFTDAKNMEKSPLLFFMPTRDHEAPKRPGQPGHL